MLKLLVKIGKEFTSNKWAINFSNQTENFGFYFQEGFELTIPYPGTELEKSEIHNLIVFLETTLKEIEDNEQSDME